MIRYLKRLTSAMFVRVKAFPMYGGIIIIIGMSAPSPHGESTDSLIVNLQLAMSSISFYSELTVT